MTLRPLNSKGTVTCHARTFGAWKAHPTHTIATMTKRSTEGAEEPLIIDRAAAVRISADRGTPIPEEGERGFRRKLNSDSGMFGPRLGDPLERPDVESRRGIVVPGLPRSTV